MVLPAGLSSFNFCGVASMGSTISIGSCRFRLRLFTLATVTVLSACAAKPSGEGERDQDGASLAAMELLFAPDQPLAGNPDVFEIQIETSAGVTHRRGGDLPASGNIVTVTNLPVDPAARVAASLHRSRINDATKTHICSAEDSVALVPGAPVSVAMSCMPVANADGAPGVRVFLKLVSVSVQMSQVDVNSILGARDWSAPLQFGAAGPDGRRMSLIQDRAGLTVQLPGTATWSISGSGHFARLAAGESLEMTTVGGQLLGVIPDTARLAMPQGLRFYETVGGDLAVVARITVRAGDDASPDVDMDAILLEEPAGSEFTVVSWNVENLFDQVDDDRNLGYGDYRIAPNNAGMSSNYGQPVEFGGVMTTWTAVKIAGVRNGLLGLDPAGPAIVALTEIESRVGLDGVAASLNSVLGEGTYQTVQFSDWPEADPKPAIGMGVISKFPMVSWALVPVERAPVVAGQPGDPEITRPILKVVLQAGSGPLTVYVNHWKSKGGPESARIRYAAALESDITNLLSTDPRADYIVVGDLNSDYNERVIMEPRHNDTSGITGINDILRAQGDELAVARGSTLGLKYNLHYELNRSARETSWHQGFNWSSLDHMILGAGLYDQRGVTYVDNSFEIAQRRMPRVAFLFREDGTTYRWRQTRAGTVTTHAVGGYSDHAPLMLRLRIPTIASPAPITLFRPGRPDRTDAPAN